MTTMAVRTVRTASLLTSADQIQVKATRAAIPITAAGHQRSLRRFSVMSESDSDGLKGDGHLHWDSFGIAGPAGPRDNAPYSFCSTMASDSRRFIMDWNSGEPSLSQ